MGDPGGTTCLLRMYEVLSQGAGGLGGVGWKLREEDPPSDRGGLSVNLWIPCPS